ncbi:Autophagy-related protein 2-like protein 1 [Seiridium cupressi]
MTPAREHWKLLDRQPETKQKRTSHNKARTGCITCKARRVKCDEQKPLCHRCERAGIDCEGYSDPVDRARAPSSSARACSAPRVTASVHLRPKQLQRRIICASNSAATSPWSSASLSPIVLSGRDASYLDAFRYHVVNDFNSWLTPGFWDSIVMRVSMEDETIRHSILGLAAMAQVGRFTQKQSDDAVKNPDKALDYSEGVESTSEHHQAALSHYAAAISSCREKLSNASSHEKSYCLKRLLISTIVFIIMEMMQGNINSAVNLVNNGLQLIQSAALDGDSEQVDEELVMTKLIFSRFSIIGGLNPCSSDGNEVGISIPKIDAITAPSVAASVETLLNQWNQTFRPLQPFMMRSAFGHHITDEGLRDFEAKVALRASDLREWQTLIGSHIRRTRDAKVRRSLLLTEVQLLITKIHLTYCEYKTASAYDAHINDFEEIVRLSDKFTDSELAGRMRFTVDFNLFPWLSFTIARCRNRTVRKHALRTFVRLVFRQGGWGNLGLVKALRAVVSIDDQWANENGTIGEAVGYSWTMSRWDYERRRIWVQFDPVEKDAAAGLGGFLLMREVAVDY